MVFNTQSTRFVVASKRRKLATLAALYPSALIIDVTSQGEQPWVKFSPFYPHGDIPVPFSPGITATSVEGIWQGLKVFEKAGIDVRKFSITNMSGIKRSSRTFGSVLGHQAGVNSDTLLSYREARTQIYVPIYQWVLTHHLQNEIEQLKVEGRQRQVVLLDYETNSDLDDLSKPLSHAALIIRLALTESS